MKKYFDVGYTGILFTPCKIQTTQRTSLRPIMVGSYFCINCKNYRGQGFDNGGDYIMCQATRGER